MQLSSTLTYNIACKQIGNGRVFKISKDFFPSITILQHTHRATLYKCKSQRSSCGPKSERTKPEERNRGRELLWRPSQRENPLNLHCPLNTYVCPWILGTNCSPEYGMFWALREASRVVCGRLHKGLENPHLPKLLWGNSVSFTEWSYCFVCFT